MVSFDRNSARLTSDVLKQISDWDFTETLGGNILPVPSLDKNKVCGVNLTISPYQESKVLIIFPIIFHIILDF